LLFLLRSVNHEELISQAAGATDLAAKAAGAVSEIAESELGSVFGIELDKADAKAGETPKPDAAPATVAAKPRRRRKTAKLKRGKRKQTAPAD
jgi:hypothetical protein